MAQGNRGFAEGLAGTASPATPGARLPPRTGILGERENRLAQLAAGTSITRVQELVDPAQCRIWELHNRDYAALNAENCADLIESFKAQGRQEVPAIVRRVHGDPDHPYEVICGARRHWTATWMRLHDHPGFKFLVEPRELTDEEAFRIADLENRSRRDLSDYERACDYVRAVDRYYDGSQQRMAERLQVTKSWLSCYLDLGKLPEEIVAAFGSPHVLGISHGAALAPLLRSEQQRRHILLEAKDLGTQQRDLAASGASMIVAAAVLRRLIDAARKPTQSGHTGRGRELVVRGEDGTVVASAQKAARGGGLTINLPAPSRHERATLLKAFEQLLDQAGSSTKAG